MPEDRSASCAASKAMSDGDRAVSDVAALADAGDGLELLRGSRRLSSADGLPFAARKSWLRNSEFGNPDGRDVAPRGGDDCAKHGGGILCEGGCGLGEGRFTRGTRRGGESGVAFSASPRSPRETVPFENRAMLRIAIVARDRDSSFADPVLQHPLIRLERLPDRRLRHLHDRRAKPGFARRVPRCVGQAGSLPHAGISARARAVDPCLDALSWR